VAVLVNTIPKRYIYMYVHPNADCMVAGTIAENHENEPETKTVQSVDIGRPIIFKITLHIDKKLSM